MLLTSPFGLRGEDSIPQPEIRIRQAIADNNSGLWQIASLSYRNPAVNQWRMSKSLTTVGGAFSSRADRNNPDPRDGTGDYDLQFKATTYTKYRTSTLWGEASYTNGKTSDVVWNETADRELLYPYLLADSIGGDLHHETYNFAGGYADHAGRWAWGAAISYVARQEYRAVDPRPRNVTGRLLLNAGAMLRVFRDYHVGLGLEMMKYKQSNEVTFKSEMGIDKIFHLTGLGSHYNRFAGEGLSTYYDGYRFALDMNLYPATDRGIFATCRLSRFTFNNIISDLNKLPLAHAWHNSLQAEAGWMSAPGRMFGGASAQIEVYRRHGTENVFGDAASSTYPIIASNEMYADNAVSLSATGRWGMRFGAIDRFHLQLHPEWSHRTTAYVEPYSYRVINHAGMTASASGVIGLGRAWMLEGEAAFGFTLPYLCSLELTGTETAPEGLRKVEQGSYAIDSSNSTRIAAAIGITRSLTGRYALNLRGGWAHRSYSISTLRDNFDITLSFIF